MIVFGVFVEFWVIVYKACCMCLTPVGQVVRDCNKNGTKYMPTTTTKDDVKVVIMAEHNTAQATLEEVLFLQRQLEGTLLFRKVKNGVALFLAESDSVSEISALLCSCGIVHEERRICLA